MLASGVSGVSGVSSVSSAGSGVAILRAVTPLLLTFYPSAFIVG